MVTFSLESWNTMYSRLKIWPIDAYLYFLTLGSTTQSKKSEVYIFMNISTKKNILLTQHGIVSGNTATAPFYTSPCEGTGGRKSLSFIFSGSNQYFQYIGSFYNIRSIQIEKKNARMVVWVTVQYTRIKNTHSTEWSPDALLIWKAVIRVHIVICILNWFNALYEACDLATSIYAY